MIICGDTLAYYTVSKSLAKHTGKWHHQLRLARDIFADQSNGDYAMQTLPFHSFQSLLRKGSHKVNGISPSSCHCLNCYSTFYSIQWHQIEGIVMDNGGPSQSVGCEPKQTVMIWALMLVWLQRVAIPEVPLLLLEPPKTRSGLWNLQSPTEAVRVDHRARRGLQPHQECHDPPQRTRLVLQSLGNPVL